MVSRRVIPVLALLSLALCAGCNSTPKGFEHVTCHVESNPVSAEVWVGGKQRDSTPCELLFNQPGEYEVHVKKAGYDPLMRRITVLVEKATEEGKDDTLKIMPKEMTVTLEPLEAGGGGNGQDGDTPYWDE